MFAQIKPDQYVNISHIRKLTIEGELGKNRVLVIHYSKKKKDVDRISESNGVTVEDMINIITNCIELDR